MQQLYCYCITLLTSSVALAVQQYWRLTRDKQWLQQEGLPLAVGIAEFWVSHAEFNSTTQVPFAMFLDIVGFLSSKQKYSFNHVIGPDEYAGSGENETGTLDYAPS